MHQLIECVPNFSEGKNKETLDAISKAIEAVKDVILLHRDSGEAAHRTVFTFAGPPQAVFAAAFAAIKLATDFIDMRTHKGEHPRIGACDVCPFVPISGIEMSELVSLVDEFAQNVSKELGIPIFLYEESAKGSKRRNLANHRVGNYEALENRIKEQIWLPDYGTFNAKTGGTVMGARNFLVAYNINLRSKDASIAKEIAYDVRQLGRPIATADGKTTFKAGLLKHVKAIGWYIEDFKIAQVSINLVNFVATPLHEVYETVKKTAKKYNVEVSGSELIGLIPEKALLEAGKFYNKDNKVQEKNVLIETAVHCLGLNDLQPFDHKKRILEYVLSSKMNK